jgi:uncharacterized membrane protein
MKKKWLIPIIFLALLFFFPNQIFAVEFTISNSKIDAYLQENGEVKVEETHIYEFEGKFNGITRELIPKEDANITDFSALENGKSLRIEKEDGLYKIHRKGKDETITVTLHYTIVDGLEVYQDVTQFYWPFFDDRNESTYEDLSITIHPPIATDNVIAFGYDEAYQTETIHGDGSVLFALKEVPSERNGDIRVAYDAQLFPAATLSADKLMREEILNAEQELADKAAAKAETREILSNIPTLGVIAFSVLLLLHMIFAWLRARMKKATLEREGSRFSTLPNQILSLPATLFYTNYSQLPPQAMAAALLDLVRQGYVTKTATGQFQTTGKKGNLPHENVLLEWLFEKIGAKGQFSFDDLTSYTMDAKNHTPYHQFKTQWLKAVKDEVDGHALYEDKKRFRLTLGLSSLLLLPFLILFPIYDLMGIFAAALILFLTVIVYAIAYNPRSEKGWQIAYDWKQFNKGFKQLPQSDWEKWTEDEQMRAYIFGLGTNDKNVSKKNDELVEAFTARGSSDYSGVAGLYTIAYIGPLASTNFRTADQSTVTTSSGNSSFSGGGGTGGGGGGSGAF